MDYISLVSPLVDVGLVSPIVKFECKDNIEHFCEVTGVGPKIETSGRSKKMAKMAAFKILYDRIVYEKLAGNVQVSPSGSFQLSNRKSPKVLVPRSDVLRSSLKNTILKLSSVK